MSIKTRSYKSFSAMTHRRQLKSGGFNVCDFEVTFSCGLHCRHCYSDCFNTSVCRAQELGLPKIKEILGQVRECGALWLCLTGGDPLSRRDFPQIYAYAKKLGFLVTIFTNACSLTSSLARFLAERPPFSVEVSVNGATQATYEAITGVPGSFERMRAGLALIKKHRLPLRIKSVLTTDNVGEYRQLKKFTADWGVDFLPDFFVLPRLNGDTWPCTLRVAAQKLVSEYGFTSASEGTCERKQRDHFFACAISGGDGIRIDPYGRLVPCQTIRTPSFEVSGQGVRQAYAQLMQWVRSRQHESASVCRVCEEKAWCESCPGRSLLETGDMEAPVLYYCELAKARAAVERKHEHVQK